MKVTIIGTGYVGLVTGVCFANCGVDVICVDNNEDKINRLNNGECIIYEPGLENLLNIVIKNKKIRFTTDIRNAIEQSEIVFSAVGTPPNEDGSADLKYVLAVAKTFGECQNNYKVFVTKSTVPVGTAEKVREVISNEHLKRFGNIRDFGLCSNPEFLKEGCAIEDVLHPDRIVIGTNDEQARLIMDKLYDEIYDFSDIEKQSKIIYCDIWSAEMIKYASNAMLATRISFMNDIARLCEKTGANVDIVAQGMGLDKRIGPLFLKAGCGYGGSCFPKDVQALIKTGEKYGVDMIVTKAAEKSNMIQKETLFEKLSEALYANQGKTDSIKGKTIAILGCAFKPNTDDMRESPAITLIEQLISNEANINVHDPIAIDNCKRIFANEKRINYYTDVYDCCTNVDAIILVTNWNEYNCVDWEDIRKNYINIDGKHNYKYPIFIDGRNMLSEQKLWKTWMYIGVGKCFPAKQ
ncbi:MAG: UDP-glucose/GDP-mannose dehydrogenase family protein [Bacteroidaceae bacterium]|nr:UDP-glucose/GDP-mannose dehydrogenase family protein [Bacteroidaceae bacterium]